MDGHTMSQDTNPLCGDHDAGLASDQRKASGSVTNTDAGAGLPAKTKPASAAGGDITRMTSGSAPKVYLYFGSKGSVFINIHGR